MVVVHKHTQYPGPGRNDRNVVGYPLGPVYAAKAGGFFFIVFGVVALMAAAFTINPIWNYGPYDPSPVSAGTQPDWYIGWVDGALRLMPGWLLGLPMFAALAIVVLSLVVPPTADTQLYVFGGFWVMVVAVAIDSVFLSRRLKRRLTAKFGAPEPGVVWYGTMRSLQFRKLRLPKPLVKRGETPE